MGKHTEKPWKVIDKMRNKIAIATSNDAPVQRVVCHMEMHNTKDGIPVSRAEAEANAEFIVLAVNAHEDLLSALKKIAYDPIGGAEAADREVLDGIVEIARAALVKAGGRKP